ncbi:MAG: hydroxyacylglutathione hydrolase [Gammaproteobacteria bacterium]|nr:hydroxyacylglutathione hydrolase [Gammaproteobacteria bacterium]
MTESLEILQIPCLQDNYGYLIHAPQAQLTAAIDTPDASAINDALDSRGWALTHILNTHHHFDHTGGNESLKAQWGCKIVGPAADRSRIPGIDTALADGDVYDFGGHHASVFDVPGHTRGHIAYHFADDGVAFVGDTLFALGCGRLFEGTPAQMWTSLEKLLALPDATRVYCAHEYTEANARFALTVDPQNDALRDRAVKISEMRARGEPTVPTSIGLERRTNPFLRPSSESLRRTLDMLDASDVEVFAEVRARKDRF